MITPHSFLLHHPLPFVLICLQLQNLNNVFCFCPQYSDMAQQTWIVPWELQGVILYSEGHYSSDTDVLNTSPGKSNARSSLTNVQKSTWQQSALWRKWPRWALSRQKTSKDKSAASYTQQFQTPQSVKGWESDRVVSVVSMRLPSVRATWGGAVWCIYSIFSSCSSGHVPLKQGKRQGAPSPGL